jgi:hypothetical protein
MDEIIVKSIRRHISKNPAHNWLTKERINMLHEVRKYKGNFFSNKLGRRATRSPGRSGNLCVEIGDGKSFVTLVKFLLRL